MQGGVKAADSGSRHIEVSRSGELRYMEIT